MSVQTHAFKEDGPYAQALSEAAQLAARMQRLTVALALAEEVIADALDNVADVVGGEGDAVRRRAQTARAVAATCHEFNARLSDAYDWARR